MGAVRTRVVVDDGDRGHVVLQSRPRGRLPGHFSMMSDFVLVVLAKIPFVAYYGTEEYLFHPPRKNLFSKTSKLEHSTTHNFFIFLWEEELLTF